MHNCFEIFKHFISALHLKSAISNPNGLLGQNVLYVTMFIRVAR